MPTFRLSCLSRTALCALALLGAPATVVATPIVVDELIGQAKLKNSSDAAELAALSGFARMENLVLSSKIDVDASNTANPAPGLDASWMLSDPARPGYFALKFGIGPTNATADTFFFRNIGDLSQLVWSNSQVQFLTGGECANKPGQCNIGRLSHYITSPAALVDSGELDSGEQEGGSDELNEVPEPAGIALLAIGALAAAGTRRRARQAA